MPGVELPMTLHRFLKGGHWFSQFVRFGFVGLLNTAFGYGVYALLILLGLAPWLALLIATVAGVLFNFGTTGRIVFRNRAASLLPRFVLVYACVYGVNALLLHVLIAFGSSPLLAQVWCQIIVVPLSFILFRRIVFRDVGRGDLAAPPRG